MSAVNGIAWFEIGTDEPAAVERFYGDVFGWTFTDDDPSNGTGGTVPNYAVFTVLVADTAATCRQAEAAGGKVLVAPQTAPNGLTFAHLLDPSGNHFGVFTPPPGR